MVFFRYEGQKINGEKVSGTLHGNNQGEVQAALKKKHIKPLVIIEQEETLATKEIQLFNKVSLKLLSHYLQQMSTLVSAGITILDASIMLEKQIKDKKFHRILEEVRQDLENGDTLSASYRKHQNAFPSLLVNVITVAEMTGELESNLKQLAAYYEKSLNNRSSLITAMVYPIMMLVASVGVAIFLMVAIVPMFIQMFESFNAPLPTITVVTIAISNFLKTKYWLLFLLLIGAVSGWKIAKRNPHFAMKVAMIKLKIPVLGEFIQKNDFSVFLITLSTLLSSSVSIVNALNMSKEVVSNLYIQTIISKCEIEIAQGGKLSNVFAESSITPAILTQMVEIGERTGSLDEMLSKLSVIFEREVDESSKRLKTVMEPLVMVVIAVIVGFIVAAIMLPMLSIYTTIQG